MNKLTNMLMEKSLQYTVQQYKLLSSSFHFFVQPPQLQHTVQQYESQQFLSLFHNIVLKETSLEQAI